jgi:hypothetical protein
MPCTPHKCSFITALRLLRLFSQIKKQKHTRPKKVYIYLQKHLTNPVPYAVFHI